MLVRLTRIAGLDLRLFDFDHDLNFYVFFLDAEERVLGRYGGRDGKSAEGRLSMVGLRHALQAALSLHRERDKPAPLVRVGKPVLAEEYPAARRLRKGECIHCHQVNEFRREDLVKEGKWNKEMLWRYPLPENVGLELSVDEGNLIRTVSADSPAARSGLRPGDRLKNLQGTPIASLADVQHALDRAPAEGEITVRWLREKKEHEGKLALKAGWRRTNITWRPSLLDVLITPSLFGDDLPAKEKKALSLAENQLAFRQDRPIPADLRKIGLREEDIIIGIEGQRLAMTVPQFLAYLRQNYLVGEQVMLNVLRDGKRVDLPLKFR